MKQRFNVGKAVRALNLLVFIGTVSFAANGIYLELIPAAMTGIAYVMMSGDPDD